VNYQRLEKEAPMILPEMNYPQRKLQMMFPHVGLPSPLFSDGTPVHIRWRKIRDMTLLSTS